RIGFSLPGTLASGDFTQRSPRRSPPAASDDFSSPPDSIDLRWEGRQTMDALEVIPPRDDPEKKPCADVYGESQHHSLTTSTTGMDVVSKVLDDDNLLREIILCVGFPTTLVCASLVCKCWYHHASDRKFLSRFHEGNPSHLLGFYLEDTDDPSVAAHFFPMLPQPAELATVIRSARFSLDPHRSEMSDMMGCRNGNVLISLYDGRDFTVGVHSPLHPERGLAVLPPFPELQIQDGYFCGMNDLLLSKEEGDGLSYIYVLVESTMERTKSMVHIDVLRNGDTVWRRHLDLATDRFLCPRFDPKAVLADDKIYIASAQRDIVVLDLMGSSISTILLPQGVEYGDRDTTLARANNASGVYLIHAKKLELCIWLHKGGNWLLVHNICLREMVAGLKMTGCEDENEATAPLRINHVGDYDEFVFLEMSRCALHLDIKYKKLRKVYDVEEKDRHLGDIHPFMMIWPPTFPTLKNDYGNAI
uniref:F-box protein AT5G49610-like beta-propeller domain-containing protein n=4 Tax=Triticinae TaxID=1648030 RepID=A0A453AEQ3_AEGTS